VDEAVRFRGGLEVRPDGSLPPQGYELHVDAERAVLVHADAAGWRHGEQTVAQLRDVEGTLPAMHVRDHPDVAVRGVMLDISRDRVPTRATLARLVGILATARYNHLQLYVEHAFAYRDHGVVWREASPLTAEDLRWLDERCAANGIKLVANQNCFGHMGRWLAHDAYRHRAECPEGVELIPGITMPPGVLAPNADNADFAVALVREQLAELRSRAVNIDCDETFELGRGASRARVEEVGLGTVYGEHLARIIRPLLDDGAAVMLWADVLAHHSSAADLLPDGDVTAVVWNYDAPDAPAPLVDGSVRAVLQELGVDLDEPTDFATRLGELPASITDPWVAAGTSSWNSLVGRLDNATANLLDAVRSGTRGLLVTDWGDGGHHQPPSVSDPALLYGGAVAWCAETNEDVDLAAAVDRHVSLDPTGTIGRVLCSIGTVHGRTGVVARNLSPLAAALFPHQFAMTSGQADPDALADVIATLEQARDDLGRARPEADDGATTVAELQVAIGLARHGALRLARPDADPAAMRADLAPLVERHREVWLAGSRPGGLDDSVAHLERTLALY
jgi:hypothetical protein